VLDHTHHVTEYLAQPAETKSSRELVGDACSKLLATVGLEAPEKPIAADHTEYTDSARAQEPSPSAARTRKEKRVERAVQRRRDTPRERSDRKQSAWEARFQERYKREHPGQSPPPCIPRAVWLTVACLMVDGSGKYARGVLRRMRNLVFAGAVRDAALAPLPGDNGTRYDWTDRRARYVLAVGYAIYSMAYTTRRVGWSGLCRGLSRHALLTLVKDPFRGTREPWCDECKSRHPSYSALSGTHRADATLDTGQIGWLRALEEAGAISRQQFKAPDTIAAMCQPWEIGEKGYPINWYWVRSALPVGLTREELAYAQALHERGSDAPTEVLQRRESYVRALQPSSQSPDPLAQPP
jgi:hypothetical protein